MKRFRWLVLALVVALVAAACGRGDDSSKSATTTAATNTSAGGSTTTAAADKCKSEPLKATEIGVSDKEITLTVMADVNTPLAPGLFQGNFDGMVAWTKWVNANGGLGCRQVVLKQWDSKLTPDEATNGNIDACKNSFAMVGSNALFNPKAGDNSKCPDKDGKPTGMPDVAALANDINQQCNDTTFIIQIVAEKCPIPASGPRTQTAFVGHLKYYTANVQKDLKGVFLVPGDLPTTRQSAISQIFAAQQNGVTWDGTPLVSGRDEQAAYGRFIQILKSKSGNYVYNGSNDQAMIKMRKEAKAQGIDNQIKVWACSLACYTPTFIQAGGADVEGTYVWMQFIPFEEASSNKEIQAYLDGVGGKWTSWGAQAWQAGDALKQVIDQIVATKGPNAITRANVLEGLKGLKDFTANGWMGKKDLKGISPCIVIMQVKGGKFTRVFPAEAGKLDCTDSNVVSVTTDPVAEAAKLQ